MYAVLQHDVFPAPALPAVLSYRLSLIQQCFISNLLEDLVAHASSSATLAPSSQDRQAENFVPFRVQNTSAGFLHPGFPVRSHHLSQRITREWTGHMQSMELLRVTANGFGGTLHQGIQPRNAGASNAIHHPQWRGYSYTWRARIATLFRGQKSLLMSTIG